MKTLGSIGVSSGSLVAKDQEGNDVSVGGGDTSLGWVNVLDHGAVADGSTDNTAAFIAAIAASGAANPYSGGSSGPPFGGIVYVPPGAKPYYFADDLHITRSVRLMGFGTPSAWSGTQLNFAPGKGIVCDSLNDGDTVLGTSSETHGTAQDTVIERLAIVCQPLSLPIRVNDNAYSLGDKVRLANDNRYYYECISAGTTAGTSPFGGDVIGDGDDFPSSAGRGLFSQTTDGTAQWQCKSAPGIMCYATASVRQCYIYGATNAGVHVEGNAAETGPFPPYTDANSCFFDRLEIDSCGMGMYFRGGDANACQSQEIQILAPGNGTSGAGGFGIVDLSFLGNSYVLIHVEGGTGRTVWGGGQISASSFVHLYTEEGPPAAYIKGVVMGGDYVYNANSPHTGHNAFYGWRNTRSQLEGAPKGPVKWSASSQYAAFDLRFSDDDGGNGLAERYYTTGFTDDHAVGEWVVGMVGGHIGERRIHSLTTSGYQLQSSSNTGGTNGGSKLGVGNMRVHRGQFRGDGATPYYVGFDSTSAADVFVRNEQGVGGHRLPGDRFEVGGDPADTSTDIGVVVYREGWVASGAWMSADTITTYDNGLYGGQPSASAYPTAQNGYAYVCTIAGTTDPSTEPTWPTGYLSSGGIVSYRWRPYIRRKIGDFGAPAYQSGVPTTHGRNGHYYKVTAVASADLDGYARAGGTEPTWPTGAGATVVDGDLTWTEQGADDGTYVGDGSTEWQCVGPTPLYRNYGFRIWVPYQSESDDVVVGAYDSDGTTLIKVVTINSAQATIGDSTEDLDVEADVLSLSANEVDTSAKLTQATGVNVPTLYAERGARYATSDSGAHVAYTSQSFATSGVYLVTAHVNCRKNDTNHTHGAGWRLTKLVRIDALSGVYEGTTQVDFSDVGDLTLSTPTIAMSGAAVTVSVTGDGTDLQWDVYLSVVMTNN